MREASWRDSAPADLDNKSGAEMTYPIMHDPKLTMCGRDPMPQFPLLRDSHFYLPLSELQLFTYLILKRPGHMYTVLHQDCYCNHAAIKMIHERSPNLRSISNLILACSTSLCQKISI